MKKTIQVATISLFFAFLVITSMQMVLRVVPEPTLLEKRVLAPRPPVPEVRDVLSDKFTTGFDAYVNDNFGFRKLLIRLNNLIDLKLLGTSSNKRVILGDSDFLFGLPDWESFVHSHTKHSDQEVLDAALKIRALQDRLKSRGIEFLFVMAPNKGSVYKEYIRQRGYLLHPLSEGDRWSRALVQAGVNQLDMLPEILQAKNERLMYYKGDHHWNRYAGLMATQRISESLASKLGVPSPRLSVTGAEIDDTEKTGGGSLDELLGVKKMRVNEQPTFTVSGKLLPPGVVFGDSFVHWLNLDRASEKLIPVADLNASKKFRIAMENPDIRFLVIHLSEAHPDDLMKTSIWNVDGRGLAPEVR
ncbi:alginate O-acetyltransferase AlgX-related protein [Polaromonas sp. CT11-55]|uniref:alginate O-acetyltransferase AlgX-related protein n=1 Tax=Polaromonas sp. CT11-55 TaxID=3243045 RepID=UPI0039A59FD3